MIDTSYTEQDIILEISDIIINDTIIKRKAVFETMIYNHKYKTISVAWNIQHYSSLNGDYGDYIGHIIPNRSKTTTADNDIMVHSSTGEFVTKNEETGEYPEPYCGQYTFFNKIAKYQPVIINDMITIYGNKADFNI